MSEPLKFTFDTAFGTQPEGGYVQETVPTFSQDDLDAARTQGYLQGREEGLNEANAQNSSSHSTIISQISQKLDQAIQIEKQNAHSKHQQAQHYALLIAKKIAQAAIKQYPSIEISNLIDECLSFINNISHLVVTVNTQQCEKTQDELHPIIKAKGYEGKLIILGQDDVNLGDCKIEWADGGVSKNTQEIIGLINSKINQYFKDNTNHIINDSLITPDELATNDENLIKNHDQQTQPQPILEGMEDE